MHSEHLDGSPLLKHLPNEREWDRPQLLVCFCHNISSVPICHPCMCEMGVTPSMVTSWWLVSGQHGLENHPAGMTVFAQIFHILFGAMLAMLSLMTCVPCSLVVILVLGRYATIIYQITCKICEILLP